MNKGIKIVLAAVAAVVALVLVAAAAITLLVDPNEYKDEIARLVQEKTGRELAFEGDIKLTLFPRIGLDVGPVALGNAPGFPDPEMVRADKAEVSLGLSPLLSGKLAVGKVVLDGLTVHLTKNDQGVANWEDLAGGAAASEETDDQEATAEGAADGDAGSAESAADAGGMSLDDLTIQGVEVTNASLVYEDMQTGAKTAIDALNLTLGKIHGTDSVPFSLGFGLKLDQSSLEVRPNLAGELQLDPVAGSLDLRDLKLSVFGLEVSGALQANYKRESHPFSGELQLAETSIRRLMGELGIELPEMADAQALESCSADMRFMGTDNSVVLERLRMELDGATFTAQGSVEDFAAPFISLVAAVDDIDADRYLPPRAASESAPAQAETAAEPTAGEEDSTAAGEPDLSALRGLTLDVSLEVGNLKVMNVKASDIEIGVTAEDGELSVSPLALNLYDGRYEGQCSLDASEDVATWTGKGSLRGVQSYNLLSDLLKKELLEGVVAVDYDLHGAGLTPDGIKKTVSGTASFSVTDGSVIGVDVAKMIRDAWNQIKGTSVTGEEPDDFDFDEVSGSASLTNGHIVNKDLAMISPLAEVSGAGWADLPKNTTDFEATVTVVGSLDGLEGVIVEAVKDIPLPVYARGKLDQPDIGLDVKAMTQVLMAGVVEVGLSGLADALLGGDDEGDSSDDADAENAEDSDDSGDAGDAVSNLIDGLL